MTGRVRAKLTYANVTATVALFATLGSGGAFAASQIGTGQIRSGAVTASKLHNSAVTSQKIKDGAVTGAKVANHTLTGAKIIASTLGQVPLASRAATADRASGADHATSADHASSADQAANADALAGLGAGAFERSGHLVPIAARMSNSDADRPILTAGPFTVTGHCAPANPQQNVISASAVTSENDSIARGHNVFGAEGGSADFDVGATQQLSVYQESGTPPLPSGPFVASWFMASPSGAQVAITITFGTRVFSDNASERAACVFGGFAVVM